MCCAGVLVAAVHLGVISLDLHIGQDPPEGSLVEPVALDDLLVAMAEVIDYLQVFWPRAVRTPFSCVHGANVLANIKSTISSTLCNVSLGQMHSSF